MWITQNNKVWYSEEEYNELKEDIETRTMCISCKRELENCNLKAENEKYKQALEEIREIIEFAIDEVLTLSQKNATDIILNKINEVLK